MKISRHWDEREQWFEIWNDDETTWTMKKSMLVSVTAFKRAKRRPTKSFIFVVVVALLPTANVRSMIILNHWICIAISHRHKNRFSQKVMFEISSIYYNHLIILVRTYAYYDQWAHTHTHMARRKFVLLFYFCTSLAYRLFASSIECQNGFGMTMHCHSNSEFHNVWADANWNGKIYRRRRRCRRLDCCWRRWYTKVFRESDFPPFFISFRLWLRLFIIIGFPLFYCVAYSSPFFVTFYWMKTKWESHGWQHL